jgi:hypothetical protein
MDMIEILPASAHVAAFHFRGTLRVEDYDHCIDLIEARLADHRRITIFCDLTGMSGIEPAAMAKDLRFALAKFGEYRRFARSAVVTEHAWLSGITKFAAMFFPHTEIRTFSPEERAAAFAWANEELPGS